MRETTSIFGLAHYLVAGIELVEGPLSLSGILTKPYVALQWQGLCDVSLAQCTKSKNPYPLTIAQNNFIISFNKKQ